MKRMVTGILIGLFCLSGVSFAFAQEAVVQAGKAISFDYKLTIDGEQVETSEGKEPITYVHGNGVIMPELEKQLEGLKVGDTKQVTLTPEQAYGEVVKEAFREVPKDSLPKDITPEVGMVLEFKGPEDQPVPAIVWEIKDTTVVLNFNHPLAGKTLQFDIKIADIKDAPAVEEAPAAATEAPAAEAPAATEEAVPAAAEVPAGQ
jgi:FKBP-type peptidyl-prolyl cis-trans isomerase SlyD